MSDAADRRGNFEPKHLEERGGRPPAVNKSGRTGEFGARPASGSQNVVPPKGGSGVTPDKK